MKHGVIYKATNLTNEKCYIGQTVSKDIIKYWFCHLKTAIKNNENRPFYRAIKKYGPENVKFEVILETNDIDNAKRSEMYLIDIWNLRQ